MVLRRFGHKRVTRSVLLNVLQILFFYSWYYASSNCCVLYKDATKCSDLDTYVTAPK